MGDSLPLNPNPISPPNPNLLPPPSLQSLSAPPPPSPPPPRFHRRPPIRATTEFDSASENPLLHKISCKLIDGLAKLKFCCQSNSKGQIMSPEIALITDRFKIFYDVDSRNALLQGWVDMGRFFRLQATRDVKVRVDFTLFVYSCLLVILYVFVLLIGILLYLLFNITNYLLFL
jgi:hypothetical protein